MNWLLIAKEQRELIKLRFVLGDLVNWGTPNTMDYLSRRSYEAMKRQATIGGRRNRKRPSNLREQVDPYMCQAYKDATAELNNLEVEDIDLEELSLCDSELNPEWVEQLMGLSGLSDVSYLADWS